MKDKFSMRRPGVGGPVSFTLTAALSLLLPAMAVAQDTAVTVVGAPVVELSHHNDDGRYGRVLKTTDTLPLKRLAALPFVNLQQLIKGNVRGVYAQESTGEPGTEQFMFIRGLSNPLLQRKDAYQAQPAVFLNGVPLIQDNTLVFDIQPYDFNRLGPAINLLSIINPDNIREIQVGKDAATAAAFGPRGANGVINIITKNAVSGKRKISINSYFGLAMHDPAYTTNAQYENRFRRQFYEKYATAADSLNYPAYLRDSSNQLYYGPANWSDSYYQTSTVHNINASISGGTERANFRFFGDKTQSNGAAGDSRFDKYNASFLVNMAPLPWLMASAMINANRMDRVPVKTLRSRFAETDYIPEISAPLAPGKAGYDHYLYSFNKSFDNNHQNSIQGIFALGAKFNRLRITSRLMYDYNESLRDIFWHSSVMDGNNYVSNYFGNNQRVGIENAASYDLRLGNGAVLGMELGQSFQADLYRYEYSRAYKGVSDRVKMNVVEPDANSANYLMPLFYGNQLTYRYQDGQKHRLLSVYGNLSYKHHDLYTITLMLRNDGSSYMPPQSRWLFTPALSFDWNLKNQLNIESSRMSAWNVRASWGRMGRLLTDDRYAVGPQYKVDMGWTGHQNASSYNAFPGISRPYTSGWVGHDISWAYTDVANLGTEMALFGNRLQFSLDVYSKNDRNMLLPIPVNAESGYTVRYESGMDVNNKGVELGVSAAVVQKGAWKWTPSLNVSYNKNTLRALPGNASEFTSGGRRLVVGEAIDRFWVLENTGIYNTDADVPQDPSKNTPVTYKGIPLRAGDAAWKDRNGDYQINDADKVLKGHFMPSVTGGFGSSLSYGHFNFEFNLYFALGQHAINEEAASRYDFVNREGKTDISSVKEITFWEKPLDMKEYPVYNPWSAAIPYRLDQDLFLENASYVKLRSAAIGYDFAGTRLLPARSGITRCYLYVSGANLFTLTGYTGRDPELVSYNGYDNGFAMPIPKMMIVGLKLDL
ncbi:SusC/RagA family TonB-linked outer membrane protein [Chitinophaga lutea]